MEKKLFKDRKYYLADMHNNSRTYIPAMSTDTLDSYIAGIDYKRLQ